LRSMFNTLFDKVGTVALGGLLSLMAFVLTPLQGFVLDIMHPENVVVSVSATHEQISLDATTAVTVKLIPRSYRAIESGVVDISYDANALRVVDLAHTSWNVQGFSNLILTPSKDEPQLIFQGIKSGETTVDAVFKTRTKSYKDSVKISVTERILPSIKNFTGEWGLQLGGDSGKLTIIDHDIKTRELLGFYKLGHEKGVVSGNADGQRFSVQMQRGESKLRWVVKATFDAPKDDQLEVLGTAKLEILKKDSWELVRPLTEKTFLINSAVAK